ncbi:hypothetical protein cypCar_00016228 [Cyprinus carpio]|nr:hypothetical protein cypCar_00016228 [Cyprinus carpio]
MQQKRNIQIIEWEDLDKRKFYSFGVFMTMAIRTTVYPATLIRTRLQVQKGKSLYTGTYDAFRKILRADGLRGLYRGFMVTTFTLISGQAYITTYELVEGRTSVTGTFNQLIREEGFWGMTKGLSARIISSAPTAIVMVVGYETLKKLSLRPELVDSRHW